MSNPNAHNLAKLCVWTKERKGMYTINPTVANFQQSMRLSLPPCAQLLKAKTTAHQLLHALNC